ncbi:hypothetical protein D3C86_1894250 [compost metagenome]
MMQFFPLIVPTAGRTLHGPHSSRLSIDNALGASSIGLTLVPRLIITENLASDPEKITSGKPSPFQSYTVGPKYPHAPSSGPCTIW